MLPELASQGYIIASIEHTGAASGTVFKDGSVGNITPFDSLQIGSKFSVAEIEKWSADQRFVLDEILKMTRESSFALSKLIDTAKVGAFGHSFGGATSAATLTMDARFLAGINLDGFYFGNKYKNGFQQPFMEIRADNKLPSEMKDKELKEWKLTREEYEYMILQNGKIELINML